MGLALTMCPALSASHPFTAGPAVISPLTLNPLLSRCDSLCPAEVATIRDQVKARDEALAAAAAARAALEVRALGWLGGVTTNSGLKWCGILARVALEVQALGLKETGKKSVKA